MADTIENRVLLYDDAGAGIDNLPVGTLGPNADDVVGQGNFEANAPYFNDSNTPNAYGFSEPLAVSVDDCQLYVSDWGGERVLVFDALPPDVGVAYPAVSVLGASSLGSTGSLNFRYGPGLQALSGEVLVSDGQNNRVLAYTCGSGTMEAARLDAKSSATPTLVPAQDVTHPGLVLAPNPSLGGLEEAFYAVSAQGQYALVLYNLLGQRVRALDLGDLDAGTYQVGVNLNGLADGVYYAFLMDERSGGGPAPVARFKLAVVK